MIALGGCPYEHTFPGYLGPDLKRPCLLPKKHPGNHVVEDPKTGKLLEVPDGVYIPQTKEH